MHTPPSIGTGFKDALTVPVRTDRDRDPFDTTVPVELVADHWSRVNHWPDTSLRLGAFPVPGPELVAVRAERGAFSCGDHPAPTMGP